MKPQVAIDSFHIENNMESQEYLENNLSKFNNQCRIVLKALLNGERLTCATALIKYHIGHLPRRICTLRKAGVNILDQRKPGGFKEYYLENKKLI
ncbi:MAG: helix-turn-helix domain-containing protein [Fusobacterium sp.]